MTEHWHGAQWVLATWFVIMTFAPTLIQIVQEHDGNADMPTLSWVGGEIGRQIGRWVLITVLWWGGFWS